MEKHDPPLSARELSRRTGWSHQAISWLLTGYHGADGTRYLGLKGRGGESPLLIAIAMELAIPENELATALLQDLGYSNRARKPRRRRQRT